MAIVEGNLVKVDKLINFEGGQLVVNLGDKKANIAPLRIMLAIAGTLISIYYYTTAHNLLLALILWVLMTAVFLFGDLDKIGKSYRRGKI
ncbi:Uncharacterised protein [Candidatus Bilamarchaeum dharawalense]|uniref:Uncharacterized protein n=1 Tax=Candidatus Bilamarchaeum dharawalense TaxID=2885759 RepID=A0A5E4LXI9_9ARCH|nr:Uncharacterised protein [Candidatus Bilamarchaeum dharawalense]